MKVQTDSLGYRELNILADFLKEINEKGIESVLNITLQEEEVIIGYSIYFDEVTINGYGRSIYECHFSKNSSNKRNTTKY